MALVDDAREFGIELDQVQLDRFEAYYRDLIHWNERINLTGITEYTQVQVKHFLDSLSVARAFPRPFETALDGKRLIDVGAGAGFPGLPLAIAFPMLQVTLLEATGKKAIFMDQLVRRLGLDNATVVHGRAEEFGARPQYREQYDYAVARAVAELRTLAEYTLPFVRVGGIFIAQKSLELEAEVAEASHAFDALGGRPRETIPIQLPGIPETRYLVVVDKVAPTPDKYPRPPGRPEKRPL